MTVPRQIALVLILLLLGAGGAQAQRDIYQQHPGFRAIEFGTQPTEVMTLVDDSREPIRIYHRAQDSTKLGLGLVEPAQYYFHKDIGFYKAIVDFRASQNQQVLDELNKQFGGVTQTLPLGPQDLLIWLRLDHTVQFTRVKDGTSSVKITSTKLTPQTGDN